VLSPVRPFTAWPPKPSGLLWPLWTFARSRTTLPQDALPKMGGKARWRFHGFRRRLVAPITRLGRIPGRSPRIRT
jgi:hypothetical protein